MATKDSSGAVPPGAFKLADTSLEYLSSASAYRVSAPLQKQIRGALQPQHLAHLPVEQFTPGKTLGLAPLTDANIAQAVENARAYAATHGGGAVMVPIGPHSGQWAIPSGTPIVAGGNGCVIAGQKAAIFFPAVSRGIPLWLIGAPGTGFLIPADCSVGVYFYSGGTTGTSLGDAVHTLSGMRQINITAAVWQMTATGLRINGNVRCEFSTIDIRNFDAGVGLMATDDWPEKSGNSQMSLLSNINCGFNGVNFDIGEFMGEARGLNSAFGQKRDFVFRNGTDLTVSHGSVQSSSLDAHVEITEGVYLTFDQVYWECGPGGTAFYIHDITSQSYFQLHRHRTGTAFDLFLDVPNNVVVSVREAEGLQYATKILRATAPSDPCASAISFINCGAVDASIAADPTRFDCTPYARKQLYVRCSGEAYSGGRAVFAAPTQLASYLQGFEPTSSVESEILWNASTHRPRVRTDNAHRDVAYYDDANGVTGLLRAYAAMILDPRIYKTRSVIGGELDALGDMLHSGTSASAPASNRRPTWNASSDAFGGKPSFTCSQGLDKMLSITLATPIPAGSYPGMFVVGRATSAVDTSHYRRFVTCVGSFLLGGEDNENAATWQARSTGTIVRQFAGSTGFSDQYPHAFAVNPTPGDPAGSHLLLWIDGVSGYFMSTNPSKSDPGGIPEPITTVYIGALSTDLGMSADVEIAYIALLNSPLPANVLLQAWDYANVEWALGL